MRSIIARNKLLARSLTPKRGLKPGKLRCAARWSIDFWMRNCWRRNRDQVYSTCWMSISRGLSKAWTENKRGHSTSRLKSSTSSWVWSASTSLRPLMSKDGALWSNKASSLRVIYKSSSRWSARMTLRTLAIALSHSLMPMRPEWCCCLIRSRTSWRTSALNSISKHWSIMET